MASTTGLEFIALALAGNTGSETQGYPAAAGIGGPTTCMLLTLLVIPAVYRWVAVAPRAWLR